MTGKPGMFREKQARHNNASKYYGLPRYALAHFRWARDRTFRRGKAPSFGFNCSREGYMEFLTELGPIPAQMKRPSVGRKDHNRGYEPGNIQWQEYNENSRWHTFNQHTPQAEEIPF